MMHQPFARLAAPLALSLCLGAPAALAEEMTPEAVKQLALEAILENPDIIVQAIEILRARDEAQQTQATQSAIVAQRDILETDPNAPVIGNPEGDVTMVEFFDYNCPYCKRAAGEVQALIAADPGVRVVYREWPILGEGSVVAARAALASREQGKYEAFHNALMASPQRKDEAVVMRIAADVGLDLDRLRQDMTGEAVESHIAQSMALAQSLGFTGTPSFVIGGQPGFGYLEQSALAAMVAEAREPASGDN